MLTPIGANAGASGGPGVAFPPSTIASIVFISKPLEYDIFEFIHLLPFLKLIPVVGAAMGAAASPFQAFPRII
jgi:hypothetical protein